ncbi:MAG: ribonuclease III [Prevotella sp.]|nr:ribonuclease III [Prevotella sp.]
MNFKNMIDRIRLFFLDEQDLRQALFDILGFYPHDIKYYKLALMHKSASKRNDKGRPLNNERLEFLGDAILDAVVGDIVYRHFAGKREGFLTNTRSKLVQRDTLNRLAQEMGLTQLITSSDHSKSHNSYMGGNAFEALVGAIYLDRGYDACMRFMQKRILAQLINIDKVAYKEVNFKSKLLEWTQKNRVRMEFKQLSQSKDQNGSPVFEHQVVIEGVEGCTGRGYSKKESQQQASKETLQRLRREPQFIDAVFAAKTERTKMEEEPVAVAPSVEKLEREELDFIIEQVHDELAATAVADDQPTADRQPTANRQPSTSRQPSTPPRTAAAATDDDDADEFSLDDIKATPDEQSREDIIAAAEAAAFAGAE